MYKKMISLTAIMAMIVTLVMPARAYADETQAESQPVLKYSVLMEIGRLMLYENLSRELMTRLILNFEV